MAGIRKFLPGSNPVSGSVLFIAALLILSVFYRYHKTLFYPPQSIHAWRQSDCASLTLNYYKEGMKFFSPHIHLLASDNGTSGYAATSEVPLLYYGTAVLYKLFGPHEFLIRLLNLLIFLSGLFYLFRLFREILGDYFWSFSLALLLFTSPLLIYYGNNYLTNAPALALGIIGFYHFFRFHREGRTASLALSAVFYFLAGSFKITGLFLLFAILAYLLLEWMGLLTGSRQKGMTEAGIRRILPYLVVLLPIIAWLVYAARYNSIHNTTHFSTTIFPIWHMDAEGIRGVLARMQEIWLPSYFNRFTLLLCGLLALSIPLNYRHIHPLLSGLTLLLLPVIILYVLFQFWTFRDHDYYLINLYILVVLVIISAAEGLLTRFPRVMKYYGIKILFALFLLMNIHYARGKYSERYSGWMNENSSFVVFREIKDKLPEFGVHPEDTVICLPGTSQLALYLVDMKGWTAYVDARYNRAEPIYYNRDSSGIEQSIRRGAKYLLIMGMDEIYRNPWLSDFTHDLAGKYGEIMVFNLLSTERNFYAGNRPLKLLITCDMESLSADGVRFRSSADSVDLKHGITRSGDMAFSGDYSSKLSTSYPFSLTRTFPQVHSGESFSLSAWLYDPEDRCRIVASGPDPEEFYYSRRQIDVADSMGWRRIITDFVVPPEMEGRELKIYLHYPGADSAYVDDYTITYFGRPGTVQADDITL
jgi:hypothetical protein